MIMTDTVLARLAQLKTTATPELKKQWRQLFDAEPPPYNRRFLESRLAYRIQELAYGGLKPETIKRLEAMGEQLDGGKIAIRKTRADERPIAGTRLIREWQGVEHSVTVLKHCYEWQGRPYKSLSAIARAIAGSRWNGWVFFGLKNTKAKS
jgi:hypothetical protein